MPTPPVPRPSSMASQTLTMYMALSQQPQLRIGNRVLSNDDWAVLQMLNDAVDGDIPRVKSKAPLPLAPARRGSVSVVVDLMQG